MKTSRPLGSQQLIWNMVPTDNNTHSHMQSHTSTLTFMFQSIPAGQHVCVMYTSSTDTNRHTHTHSFKTHKQSDTHISICNKRKSGIIFCLPKTKWNSNFNRRLDERKWVYGEMKEIQTTMRKGSEGATASYLRVWRNIKNQLPGNKNK